MFKSWNFKGTPPCLLFISTLHLGYNDHGINSFSGELRTINYHFCARRNWLQLRNVNLGYEIFKSSTFLLFPLNTTYRELISPSSKCLALPLYQYFIGWKTFFPCYYLAHTHCINFQLLRPLVLHLLHVNKTIVKEWRRMHPEYGYLPSFTHTHDSFSFSFSLCFGGAGRWLFWFCVRFVFGILKKKKIVISWIIFEMTICGWQRVSNLMHESDKLLKEGSHDAVNSALESIVEALSISMYSEKLLEMKGRALCFVCTNSISRTFGIFACWITTWIQTYEGSLIFIIIVTVAVVSWID